MYVYVYIYFFYSNFFKVVLHEKFIEINFFCKAY